MLAADFWPDYPVRTPAQLAEALRVVYANARPGGDWRTPFERGAPVEEIVAFEQRQLDAERRLHPGTARGSLRKGGLAR